MSKTFPWKNGPVSIFVGKDKTLGIRAVKPGDKAEMIFKSDELESLYATLAGANMPVRSKHFVLMGKTDKGVKAVPPEITNLIRDRATGNEKEQNYAYVSEQLDNFVPQSFTLRARPGYMGDPEPIFMVFDSAWERSATETIQRVTVRKAKEEPEEPVIPRRQGRQR